jgi:hypothetical protein
MKHSSAPRRRFDQHRYYRNTPGLRLINLPLEYLEEQDQLRKLLVELLGSGVRDIEFHRVYKRDRNPHEMEIIVNSPRRKTNTGPAWGRFLHWGVTIKLTDDADWREYNVPVETAEYEGVGDTPLVALQEATLLWKLQRAYV